MQLTGNTVFITGGTSGISRGLAEALHKAGNVVIISGRRVELLDEVTRLNPGMKSVRLDVTDAADIERVARQLVRDYPSLNVLINNAGIMTEDDASTVMDDSVLVRLVTTNLLAPIRMTSALIEHLKGQPRATVLYTTSGLAYVPLASNAAYCATKAGLHSYILSQRFMLRDSSVRVQEIAPPWVDTDLVHKSGDPRAMPLEVFIEQTMQVLGSDAEEILVDAVKWLRGNPGANEHALVNSFNRSVADNPVPEGQ